MGEDNQQSRRRLTAEEVRKKYGIGSVLLLAWEIWCIRDGWFHPQYEYIGFSRSMAWLSAPILAFCVIMAVSAARALQRQRERTSQNESTDSSGPTT